MLSVCSIVLSSVTIGFVKWTESELLVAYYDNPAGTLESAKRAANGAELFMTRTVHMSVRRSAKISETRTDGGMLAIIPPRFACSDARATFR